MTIEETQETIKETVEATNTITKNMRVLSKNARDLKRKGFPVNLNSLLDNIKEEIKEVSEEAANKKFKEKQDLVAAKKVVKERGFSKDLSAILEREDLLIDEKVISLIHESLDKLSLVKRALHDEDLLELRSYELDGTKQVIYEVFNLLDAAMDLHTATH